MEDRMNRKNPLGLGLVCLFALLGSTPQAGEGGDIQRVPAADLAFDTTQEGVGFAALEGDRFSEPYMAMVRLPAGLASPVHKKSANMFGVIVEGEMVHFVKDDNSGKAIRLGPGSYYKIPKDVPHISQCVSSVECVTFLYPGRQI